MVVYLPEAKVRLESLCELTCDTLIDSRYFYRLAHICQQIQRIIIINNNLDVNHGITKLIEFQKNLKYFKWVDDFIEDYDDFDWEKLGDPYTEIFDILKNYANTLNYFAISLQFDYSSGDYDYTFLLDTLLELQNLKLLVIRSPLFLDIADLNEKLEMVAYRDLEILEIDFIDIYQATYIIKNSLHLRKLLIINFYDKDSFNDGSLNFIRTIYEYCLLIEYLTIP
ncbi:hypothetical protein RhiirC2_803111, partial [Rhizophagus irregularis]